MKPEIVDRRVGVALPIRQRTTQLVVHKYGPAGYPHTVDGLLDAFKTEPWSVAAVTLRGNWDDKRVFIEDWQENGIPDRYSKRSFPPYHLAIDHMGAIHQLHDLRYKTPHAGNANGRSFAVVMLGDFDKEIPTFNALMSLRRVFRWVLADEELRKFLKCDHGLPEITWHDRVRAQPHGCPGRYLVRFDGDGNPTGPLIKAIEWAEGAARLMQTPPGERM